MATNQQNKEEEVDLGRLFIIIGKGFANLFNFIGGILKGIFHLLILFLIFIKTNFVKFAVASILGGIIGGFFHYKGDDAYISEMLVQPNYESTKQLYNLVNYYGDLVKQEEHAYLAKAFGIDSLQASSLRKIRIKPIENDKDIVEAYDELIETKDSITVSSFSFNDFKAGFTKYDYRVHAISVKSLDKEIFSTLGPVIIKDLKGNNYLNRVVALNYENFKRTDSVFRRNLSQMDSLSSVYMAAMLEEAKKESSGTSIDMGSREKSSKELDLFVTKRDVNWELNKVVADFSDKSEIVHVLSKFQPVGVKISGVENNYAFLGFFIAFGLMLLYLSILELIKYLDNYQK